MANAAIKPRAEAACRLCRGGAVKTGGQSPASNLNNNKGDSHSRSAPSE